MPLRVMQIPVLDIAPIPYPYHGVMEIGRHPRPEPVDGLLVGVRLWFEDPHPAVQTGNLSQGAPTQFPQFSNLRIVPKSLTENNPTDTTAPVDAASTGYRPSTLVQTSLADATPIVEVNFSGPGDAIFFVPGYIAVPQGRIHINADVSFGSGKSVQLLGAVLAAKITRTGEIPALLELGFVNRVVQKTFKIVAKTPESIGKPYVVSVAIVQVNDYGEYAVNSWVTNS